MSIKTCFVNGPAMLSHVTLYNVILLNRVYRMNGLKSYKIP